MWVMWLPCFASENMVYNYSVLDVRGALLPGVIIADGHSAAVKVATPATRKTTGGLGSCFGEV